MRVLNVTAIDCVLPAVVFRHTHVHATTLQSRRQSVHKQESTNQNRGVHRCSDSECLNKKVDFRFEFDNDWYNKDQIECKKRKPTSHTSISDVLISSSILLLLLCQKWERWQPIVCYHSHVTMMH